MHSGKYRSNVYNIGTYQERNLVLLYGKLYKGLIICRRDRFRNGKKIGKQLWKRGVQGKMMSGEKMFKDVTPSKIRKINNENILS